MTERHAAELLQAGGVLPLGTEGAGERAVPLTARSYRHPGLDDRVVVRLVAGELGRGEDVAAGYLGLEPAAEPVEVGLGLRQALGFPEWVLAHHPQDGHHALGLMPELERLARQAKSKPKAALDAYQALAAQLSTSVPHFLPTFYEQAGRVFLALENHSYAAQLFTRARRAEAEHGLPLDEERLDAVFLEFALAGALPVKVLSGYAKELAARVPAAQAFERFGRLCVRRTAGGLPPSAQMAADLRRLARAAGADPELAEGAYLVELLALPATLRAAAGWWKGHRPALVALARREPAVRGTLLNLMPSADDLELPALWLEILTESGAVAGLHDAGVPQAERPADGAAGWFDRFLAWRGSWRCDSIPALHALVDRMADRLRAELAASGGTARITDSDVDLLDQLLAQRIPVADPDDGASLSLGDWAEQDERRDLLALAADARFRRAFDQGARRLNDDRAALAVLVRSPGGRPMLARWMAQVARESTAAGLPGLPAALHRLGRLPGEVLALAEPEVRAAVGLDIPALLARTLRGGLLDELGWPAWEEAVAALVPRKDVDHIVVADAWPHLLVAGPQQARVIGAEGTVLTHDLRIPAGDLGRDAGLHYVDGSLLVQWYSRRQGQAVGYWHTAADRVFTLTDHTRTRGTRMTFLGPLRTYGLPLPGGGRTTGEGVLQVGDTTLPGERPVIGDGTSFWVWAVAPGDDRSAWHEYDPATGALGRAALPGFFADGLREAPTGSTFGSGWLRPAPIADPTPCGAPVDGLLGWRTVRRPDGTVRGEDLAGNSVTLSEGAGVPTALLLFPGTERPQAVVRDGYRVRLVDQDGVVTATARTDNAPGSFAAGSLILPPVRYWACLRPRDPQGSAALRGLPDATAVALLKAAGAVDEKRPEELTAAVRALLPEVGDHALLAGIIGVLRFAAVQQQVLDTVARRLADKLAGVGEPAEPTGPTDQQLRTALSGLGCLSDWYGDSTSRHVAEQLAFLATARRADAAPSGPGALHVDGTALPLSRLIWSTLPSLAPAVALRAATAEDQTEYETLRHLLGELAGLGLTGAAGAAHWRTHRLELTVRHLCGADGTVRLGLRDALLALGGGAFLLFADSIRVGGGDIHSTVLHHDPAGRFEVPAPYTVLSSAPVDGPTDDRAALLAAELDRLALAPEPTEAESAPWFPEAAERFAALTGVTSTMAALVVAGLPQIDSYERNFLSADTRALLGLKMADAAVARDELRLLDGQFRRRLVASLLPAEPARLWSQGPDVDAAAELWNAELGRRIAVPEALLAEAARAVRTNWAASRALAAVLDPAGAAALSTDLAWTVRGDRCVPVEQGATGFTADILVGAVAMTAWLAHRLPAGDPLRAGLPAALEAVRARLANPELILDLGRFVSLPAFQRVAGPPTEVGEGFERYGAVIMATKDTQPAPGIRTALLDAAGEDPYLPALRLDGAVPFPAEAALRLARAASFAAQLAEPGEPAAGGRGADGTWWPQDPSRSVPDLVAAVSQRHGLGPDAAALYLILLGMPDPTDRNTARWTGWRPARLKAARAELAGTDLVVAATRSRAGRSLFLPGGWAELRSPQLPLETWKLPMLEALGGQSAPLGVLVPVEPAQALYRRAWQRLLDGDLPRFEELRAPRGRRR
ncbi:DNA-binding protein [Kitasatospora sp. NBC_01266]|uniref:DNA-binding protein n=1 Tax=Kitasatospora sp. NBC_01266 TaxID=2903572 RepID=UPI002E31DF3F|nr:DNA-binding protein [Kitasatospora sp. NBC_01266]